MWLKAPHYSMLNGSLHCSSSGTKHTHVLALGPPPPPGCVGYLPHPHRRIHTSYLDITVVFDVSNMGPPEAGGNPPPLGATPILKHL